MLKKYIPAVFLFIVILVFWEIIVRVNLINQRLLPSPSVILYSLFANWDNLLPHILQTLIETLIGLLLSIIFGLATAVVIDMSAILKKAVYPMLITSQTIPMIALAPLFLLWFGFNLLPKVIIVILSCFFPIAVSTADGLANIDTDLIKLFKSMNATYWQTLFFVRLPGAMPEFFSGLKIATTYSVTGAIVGEYVGAYQGLGIYMQEMAHSYVISLVFAAILITALLSLLLVFIVVILERIALPWNKKNN